MKNNLAATARRLALRPGLRTEKKSPISRDNGVWVADRDGGNPRVVASEANFDDGFIIPLSSTISWSVNNDQLLFSGAHEGRYLGIYIIDLAGNVIRAWEGGSANYGYPSWSPDNRYLAYIRSTDTHQLYIYDMIEDTHRASARIPAGDLVAPRWSADAQYILLVAYDNFQEKIALVDMNQGIREIFLLDAAFNADPFWLPDGKRFLFQQDLMGKTALYEYEIASGNITLVRSQGFDIVKARGCTTMVIS